MAAGGKRAIDDAFDGREAFDESDGGDAGGPRSDDLQQLPVVPLGVLGNKLFFMDASRQFREFPFKDLTRLGVESLFGNQAHLLDGLWPRYNKDGEATGWKPELAARALSVSCHNRGAFDPSEMMRGRGCWRTPGGELAMHCGDAIYFGIDDVGDPGVYGPHVYAAAAALPGPAKTAVLGNVGRDLLDLLGHWHWGRPGLDAELLLGWIGAAFLGAALEWRPVIWLTGDAATGKSTLQSLLGKVMAGWLKQATDATAAGIWQALKMDCLPVALDELEPGDDNRKQNAVILLMRQAASGGLVLRGGADHVGSSFTARSAFLASSILIPPLQPQDRQRIAILDLLPLAGIDPPALDDKRLARLGALLRARLAQEWHRFGRTLDLYRQALGRAGLSGRGASQYGVLLAASDMLLYEWSEDDREVIETRAAAVVAATVQERAENRPDWEECLSHLLSSPVQAFRGGSQKTVGQWIRTAVGLALDDSEGGDVNPELGDQRSAREILASHGIAIKLEVIDGRRKPAWVAVANNHVGLARLFQQTKWGGAAGAAGVWRQALGRVTGADANNAPMRFAGALARFVALPLDQILSGSEREELDGQ